MSKKSVSKLNTLQNLNLVNSKDLRNVKGGNATQADASKIIIIDDGDIF